MNKAFEKILERLEKATYRIDDSATLSTRDVVNEEDAKEIVQEVAEEYTSTVQKKLDGFMDNKGSDEEWDLKSANIMNIAQERKCTY